MENFDVNKLTNIQVEEVFNERIQLMGRMEDTIEDVSAWVADDEDIEQFCEERDYEEDKEMLYIMVRLD